MSKTHLVKVPDIGDYADVPVIEILVSPGDRVEAETPLVTLESDKAAMDIPAPMAGTVVEISIAVGDEVSEGTALLVLELDEAGAQSDAGEAKGAGEGTGSKETTGEGDAKGSKTAKGAGAAAAADELASVAAYQPVGKPSPTAELAVGDAPARGGSYATPSVRRLARELGADLAGVVGTGRKGRILEEDVKRFVKERLSAPGVGGAATGSGIPPIPAVDHARFGEVETKPLGRIRKLSAAHLSRAWLNVPHVTHHDEADITELEKFRQLLKPEAAERGVRVTLLAFVLKAVAAGLAEFPNFNASLAPDGESLVFKKYFNIGVAVDTPDGLVVPVLRDVDKKGVFELAAELGATSARAREGKLKLDDLQGGCISISSLGGIGGTAFTPIVNAPQVAILGLTRARMTPVWDGNQFEPRLMQPLDLSYDHRVIDGAEAARFVVALARTLGDLRRLVL
ncbi:MAG: pyruvate dehydrogenase E2 component (dihydrolipoamide acetyltransferase) [Hyphomicrobiaceae bacterium]